MQPSGPPARKFHFGQFEVDEGARQVYKHGLPILLRGQSFDVLIRLLERQGQVVTREELRSQLWPAGTHVEFEPALNSIVNRLRDALGRGASKVRYIQTVPRVGYRFAGHLLDSPAESSASRPLRLVVLPFVNMSGDPKQEYLCDGLTEELIGQLAMLGCGRLSVIARTSSMHYKGTRKSVAAIARELRVDYVLEGSIRRSGDLVRVTAQFIASSGQDHVWANNYDGKVCDLLRFQQEVALAVAAEIRCATAPYRMASVAPRAYDAYLRGRLMASRLSSTGLAAAVELLEEAVSLEPGFAKAWAMLSQVWADSGFWNHSATSLAYSKAGYAARHALSLDDTLAEAHRALGTVHWLHHWNLETARREFLRAVELKPSDAPARLSLAAYLASMACDFPRARLEAERARELDPLAAPIWGNSAWIHLWAREYEQAITLCRRGIDLDARDPSAYYVLGLSLAALARWPEAIQVFETGNAVQSGNMMLGYLGMAYASAGDQTRATEVLGELEVRAQSQPVLPTSFAFVHMGLGNHEIALDWLERALEERDPHSLWLPTSPRWDPIRRHPRFMALVARLPGSHSNP
jgi:TolB-like protein/Flp pilus assembly protein TadD